MSKMLDLADFEETGRIWLRDFFKSRDLDALASSSEVCSKPGARLRYTGELNRLLGATSTLSENIEALGMSPIPVRLVAFDKSSDANWGVPWHQDRVIAVKAKVATEGHKNWLRKNDYWHCEPPLELLENMCFVRVHLDPCNEANGAMEVALGSHKHGLVEASKAVEIAHSSHREICEAKAGDVLVLKALTLHRSKSAARPSRRRTLRVDYAKRSDLHPRLVWSITDAD